MKRTLSRSPRSSQARASRDRRPGPARGGTRVAVAAGEDGRQGGPASNRQGNYRDFVITARRVDARKVGVSVETSPVGRLDALVPVVYPEKEAAALRNSFIATIAGQRVEVGRMLLTGDEA